MGKIHTSETHFSVSCLISEKKNTQSTTAVETTFWVSVAYFSKTEPS